MYNKLVRGAFTAGGSTYWFEQEPFRHTLSDSAGHGVLIATDNIYVQIKSQNTVSTNDVRLKIFYRWKNVGLQEYIGIVQSQQ